MENVIKPFLCCKVLAHSSSGHATLRLLLLPRRLTEFLCKIFLEALVTTATNWRSDKHSWRNTHDSKIPHQGCPDCLLIINNRLNTDLSQYNLCPGQKFWLFYRTANLLNRKKTSKPFLEVIPVNSSLSASFRVYKWPKHPAPLFTIGCTKH
jgi:hypothetical protein